eukprot:3037784-Pyramimonas_sp.AAC.1
MGLSSFASQILLRISGGGLEVFQASRPGCSSSAQRIRHKQNAATEGESAATEGESADLHGEGGHDDARLLAS